MEYHGPVYCLVAYAPDGVRRFPVSRPCLVIGSEPDCDVYLPYTGVAHRHATLHVDGDGLRIEDLGSRRGVLVSGRKVRESALEVLDEIRVGGVTLLVEDVLPEGNGAARGGRRRAAAAAARHAAGGLPPAADRSHRANQSVGAGRPRESGDLGGAAAQHPGRLRRRGDDPAARRRGPPGDQAAGGHRRSLADRRRFAAQPGPGKCRRSPPIRVRSAALAGHLAGSAAWICYHFFVAVDRSYTLIFAFPGDRPGDWDPAPALAAAGDLVILGLVHHVGYLRADPARPPGIGRPDPRAGAGGGGVGGHAGGDRSARGARSTRRCTFCCAASRGLARSCSRARSTTPGRGGTDRWWWRAAAGAQAEPGGGRPVRRRGARQGRSGAPGGEALAGPWRHPLPRRRGTAAARAASPAGALPALGRGRAGGERRRLHGGRPVDRRQPRSARRVRRPRPLSRRSRLSALPVRRSTCRRCASGGRTCRC